MTTIINFSFHIPHYGICSINIIIDDPCPAAGGVKINYVIRVSS